MRVSALLLHGMGRTSLSMALLARRLRAAGMEARCFGYMAALERFPACRVRLLERIVALKPPYVLIGHSLGSVLIRSVLPELATQPIACFFLTPPTVACRLARRFAPRWYYRMLNGEMGQLLADPEFMAALPVPSMPTTIYTGTRGFLGRFSPFAEETNDWILSKTETMLPDTYSNIRHVEIFATHSFIMNKRIIADDIIAQTRLVETGDRG